MRYITGHIAELKDCRYIIFNREPTVDEMNEIMGDESMIKVIFVKKDNKLQARCASSVAMMILEDMMDFDKYGSIENYIRELDRLLRIELQLCKSKL